MKLARIERLAATGELEVEHLLAILHCQEPDAAQRLARLSSEHGWSDVPEAALQATVPFATWVRVISSYLLSGIEGLTKIARENVNTPFVLAVLEELGDVGAVQGMLTIFKREIDAPESNVPVSFGIASSLNQILSFKSAPKISDTEARQIRTFLLKLYPLAVRDVDRATIVLALRGVGDQDTLAFLATVRAFSGAWSEVKATTVRSIKKRISASTEG